MHLLHEWLFPSLLSSAVYEHHEPVLTDEAIELISAIVNLANYMAMQLSGGFNDYMVDDLFELESAKSMGLTQEYLDIMLNKTLEQFEEKKLSLITKIFIASSKPRRH